MRDLLLIRTSLCEVGKLKVNKKFYKSLGVDGLVIEPFYNLTRDKIKEIIVLNDYYARAGIALVVRFDIKNLMARLLGQKNPFVIDFSDPKIRQGLYHFLAYLIRHGIKGFDLVGLEELGMNDGGLVAAVRELNKNTFFNKDILSLAKVNADKNTMLALASPKLSCLSLVRPGGRYENIMTLAKDFERVNSGFCLSFDNFNQSDINFDNYPLSAKRLIYMTLFFLKGSLYIKEDDLDIEDVEFLRELFPLKKKVQDLGKMSKILPKEKDVLAFIREGNREKILFLGNFSEKEVLLDIAFKILDYKDYDFLAGSLGHRTLYRTIVLRPYEAIAFINCK